MFDQGASTMARAEAGQKRDQLRVRVISDERELKDLAPVWRELHAADSTDAFIGSEWLIPWWRHLGQSEPGRQLFIMLATDHDGTPRGLMPLYLGTVRLGLQRVRRLGFMGDTQVGSDYLEIVALPGWRALVVEAFGATLARHAGHWDLIELLDMDETSSTADQLLAAMGSQYMSVMDKRTLCPGQTLDPGEPFESFLRQTRRRDNYGRRRRWLERQPGFRIDVSRNREDLARPLDAFFRLHARRWANDGGSAGISESAHVEFHREAASNLAANGKLWLFTMWLKDQPLASVYGITHNKTFYYYQSGMDPAWHSRSVGLVLIGETFSEVINSGMQRYDFLRGEEAYKADWVSGSRQLVGWRLFPCNGRGARAAGLDRRIRSARRMARRGLNLFRK